MIYLDHAATTPLDPRVLDAMLPWLRDYHGNPSSLSEPGRRALAAIEDARDIVAADLAVRPAEIVFTSGGTESDNLAVLGIAHAKAQRGRHIVSTSLEHHAVLRPMERLAAEGFEVEYLGIDEVGRVSATDLIERLHADTVLVSVQGANNEIGVIQPIAEIGAICRAGRVSLHVDAVQWLPETAIRPRELGIDLLSASAHKLHGPKGVGFLYVRSSQRPQPQLLGGPQERGRRGGTENVAGIVGLGAAMRLLTAERDARGAHVRALRDRLLAGLLAISGCVLNGPREGRLANNVNVSFDQISGENLLIELESHGIAASTGSACSARQTEPSHVQLALHGDAGRAQGSLRLTLGPANDLAQVDTALAAIENAVAKLRSLSPARAN